MKLHLDLACLECGISFTRLIYVYREFTLAEIEHFVNPGDKSHPKFKSISDLTLTLFPREDQVDTQKTREMTLGDAVKNVSYCQS